MHAHVSLGLGGILESDVRFCKYAINIHRNVLRLLICIQRRPNFNKNSKLKQNCCKGEATKI